MSSSGSRVPRFFIESTLVPGTRLVLPPEASHHALRVLRLREADRVTLFNGAGGESTARIVGQSRDAFEVEIDQFMSVERESPLAVTLAQGISTGDRMDLTIQKAVELGVAAIQPLMAERSVVRLKGDRSASRRQHWERIVVASCEQCGRNRIPRVSPALSTTDYHAPKDALKLLLSPGAQAGLRSVVGSERKPVVLAAGPEAGFSLREEAFLVAQGFVKVHLGPRVLRTETAGPAALAVLNALAGDG